MQNKEPQPQLDTIFAPVVGLFGDVRGRFERFLERPARHGILLEPGLLCW